MSINSIQGNYSTNACYEKQEVKGNENQDNRAVFSTNDYLKDLEGKTPIDTGALGVGTYYEANDDGTYTIYTQGTRLGSPLEEKETLTQEELKAKYPTVTLPMSTQNSETEAADIKDGGLLKNIGNGILFNLKQSIPVLGTYTTGEIENEHQAIMNELTNGDEYDISDSKKGVLSTIGKGILTKLAYSTIPFYGTYKLGKEALENEYAYDKLTDPENTGDYEEPGFFKCMGKGITKALSLAIPGFSAYTKGKDIDMQNQIYEQLQANEQAEVDE